MILENKILSQLLDQKDLKIITENSLNYKHFKHNQKAFNFIVDYYKQYQQMPSISSVATECPSFEYLENLDNVKYLSNKLIDEAVKVELYDLLQNKTAPQFSQMGGIEFQNWLTEQTERIRKNLLQDEKSGTNYKENAEERWEWYEEAEKGERVIIPTPYPKLNTALSGGNDLGDYILLLSYTNQGKSWVSSHFGLAAWEAGHSVLHYSPEMSKKQTILRLDTLKAHFSNIHLSNGELNNKEEYKKYLEKFKEEVEEKADYIVKTMEDMDNGLTLKLLEEDLINNPAVKFVIIDGFNLMDHRGQDGNRNNMSLTSRKLRKLFGKYDVVGLVVHHTPTTSRKEQLSEEEDIANSFPNAPKLTDYSETVAVIQDAVTVLTFAQKDGNGVLAVRKARKPCVDFQTTLHVNFNMGYIKEVDIQPNTAQPINPDVSDSPFLGVN